MAPRRVDSRVPRWQRWSSCALTALVAGGCGQSQPSSLSDGGPSAYWAPASADHSQSTAPTTLAAQSPIVLYRLPTPETPEAIAPPIEWAPIVVTKAPAIPTTDTPTTELAPTEWSPTLLAPRELADEAYPAPTETAAAARVASEPVATEPVAAAPSAEQVAAAPVDASPVTPDLPANAADADQPSEAQPPSPSDWASTFASTPYAKLVEDATSTPTEDRAEETPAKETAEKDSPKVEQTVSKPASPPAEELLADASPLTTGEPTSAMVCQRAQEKIQRAYALAQRGAYFASRTELVDVLRMLADAKDRKHGAARRSILLADGLRALDEAADFCPQVGQADSDVNVKVIISSHRTPVGKSDEAAGLMPQQLADLYLRYAQRQLGEAVDGEPAGSMALHALGKIYGQLDKLEPEKQPLADRQAFALQQAALVARADNYLAAHELGMLLAETGHYAESETLLGQVATRQANPVVLRNLARVQRKLGREELAVANERQAQVYAARTGAPATNGVMWVPPQALAQTSDGMPPSRRVAAAPQQPGGPVPTQYRR